MFSRSSCIIPEPRLQHFPGKRKKKEPGQVRNTSEGLSQVSIPHPYVQPSFPAELGRGRAPLLSPLSVLLRCTACKAQPVPSTGQVPAAPTDKGSNPGSVEVQWCQKTQETGLDSRILSTKRFPAALHPPWATH